MRLTYRAGAILLILVLFGCTSEQQNTVEDKEAEQGAQTIEERAAETMEALNNKDMQQLSQIVDPDRGVAFSPYAYVDQEKSLIFTADQIKDSFADETVYTWGNYDGRGDSIQLTFADYYDKFVYDEDYVNAEQVSYNDRIGTSNTIDNTSDLYPDATVVEYHFAGFEEQYDGMDWKSLRLVFERTVDVWYLVAVIHDQWTI